MPKKRRKISNARYQQSHETKDKGNATHVGILDWKRWDGEVKFYTPEEGDNKINLIPFEVKSKKHPLVKAGKMEVGDLDYFLDVWVHRYVGPQEVDVLCPKKNYGRHCPICDMVSDLYKQKKNDDAKAIKPSRRVFYNVQPIIKGKPQPLQIWGTSHFLFEKELIEEAHACLNGSDIIPFADIEEGSVIKFRGSKTSIGKNEYLEFKSFAFLERETEVSDDLIDEAVSFDDLLIIMSAEEIEKVFYGDGEDNKDDDDKEAPQPEPEKKHERLKEKEPDEEPRERKRARPAREEEPDEEPAEKPVKKKATSGKSCQHGHKWGSDCDEYKECKTCEDWDDCIGDS